MKEGDFLKQFIFKHEAELFLLVASIMICFISGWSKSSITLLLSALLTPLFVAIFKNLYLELTAISLMFCISGMHSIEIILTVTLTCFFTALIHYNNNYPLDKEA